MIKATHMVPTVKISPCNYRHKFNCLFVIPTACNIPYSCFFVVIFMIMVFAIFINPMSPTIAINR